MNPPLWGSQTAKALENFDFQMNMGTPRELVRALAEVKLAALEGIQEYEDYFADDVMRALRKAAQGVIRGDYDEAFPLPLAQGGAGTSLHMNINEVLVSLVEKEIPEKHLDSIEDLARFQSTNDTFASSVVILAFRLTEKAEKRAIELQEKLTELELKYDKLLITGRTEMQDALPMRAGSIFGAWAGALERDRWRLSKVAERVREVPLGGTALGTGFGAPRGYAHAAERHLRRITGLPLSRSQNMVDAVALKDSLAEVAGSIRLAALNISRMAGDMLYYSSAAVGEFVHPNLQYGSSMMPLKTNPVLLERCKGLALSAMGEADKVDVYAREGQLQLNAYLPFICRSLIAAAGECLTAQGDFLVFLNKLTPDARRMELNLSRSPALLNALMPLVGYRALKDLGETVKHSSLETLDELAELVAGETGISLEAVYEALKVSNLTGPPKLREMKGKINDTDSAL